MDAQTDCESTGAQGWQVRRVVLRAALFVSVVVVLAVPGLAYSSTTLQWVTKFTLGGGDTVGTSGFAARNYIEASRTSGACVQLAYEEPYFNYGYSMNNCVNEPFHWSQTNGYARAWCINTDSGYESYNYCETTKP